MSRNYRWAGWNRGMRRYDKGNGSYGYVATSSLTSTWIKACVMVLLSIRAVLIFKDKRS